MNENLRIETSSKVVILEVKLLVHQKVRVGECTNPTARVPDTVYHREAGEEVSNEDADAKWAVKISESHQINGEPRLKVMAEQ